MIWLDVFGRHLRLRKGLVMTISIQQALKDRAGLPELPKPQFYVGGGSFKFLTTRDAAARLGKTPAAFRKWAQRHGVIALAAGRYYDNRDIEAAMVSRHRTKCNRRTA